MVSGAVVVSANEIKIAIAAGFKPYKMVFSGNGKTQEEMNIAVDY